MRVIAATTLFAVATAFRTNLHSAEHMKAEGEGQQIGDWSEIPGYRVIQDAKCGGSWIEFWESGDYAFYGQSDSAHAYGDNLECARECNQHSECAGFYVKNGNCAHWRQGELQDMTHRQTWGSQCYVKWQAEDLSNVNVGPAPPPAPPPTGDKRPEGPQVSDCLCVFDVDRTLTAKQGWYDCPGTEAHNDVPDWAYNGGTLILSDLAQGIKESEACGSCYMGMVSAGTASGPNSIERTILDGLVEPQYDVGGYVEGCPSPVWGTKVMACGEGIKQRAVDDIIAWLGNNGVTIDPHKVHFYDDKENNIGGFINSGYHAHQISCASRDGNRGGCGGTRAELVGDHVAPGQHFC
jgi:hypothetical protein